MQLALYVYYTVYMFCAMPKEKNISMLSTFVPYIDIIYAGIQKSLCINDEIMIKQSNACTLLTDVTTLSGI